MWDLRQSTAITIPIFCHDSSGDAVTSLVDGAFTKRISKNGGAFAAMTVTITEMENGWYSVPLSTTHTNTKGVLTCLFTHASCKQVNIQFKVNSLDIDRLCYPTTEGYSIDVTSTGQVGLDFNNVNGTYNAQTGDSFARLGAPAGASVSADIAANQTDLNTIIDDTDLIDDATSGLAKIATDVAAILADTDVIDDGTSGLVKIAQDVAAILVDTAAIDAMLPSSTYLKGSADADGGMDAADKADVNAQVLDVIQTDTFAQPGQGTPAATQSILLMLQYLYKEWRNASTTTAAVHSLLNDDASTVDQKRSVSDDATTFTKGEMGTGP